MENTRIKVKIGPHEFEAEGPSEIVKDQFDAFKSLIDSVSVQTTPAKESKINPLPASSSIQGTATDIQLDKISRADGRVVSLTVKPDSEGIAAMLIMLAQKTYRNNDTVTASEIKDGLEQSGYRPDRIDRIMQPLADEGSVVRIGAKKGTRYRFTNQGMAKAQAEAKETITNLP